MNVLADQQRWWVVNAPTSFNSGRTLYVSDSPKTSAWALMTRWSMARTAKWPTAFAAVGLSFLALTCWAAVAFTPSGGALLPVACILTVVALVAIVAWAFIYRAAWGQPYSILHLNVESPDVVAEQLEDFWSLTGQPQREELRQEVIRAKESFPKDPSPRALQQKVVTTIERARYRHCGEESSED